MKAVGWLLGTLKSSRLAVLLLAVLALLSALGTLVPVRRPGPPASVASPSLPTVPPWGLGQGPVFLGAVGLLAVNVLACTAGRWRAAAGRARREGRGALLTLGPDLALHGALILTLAGALVRAGWGFVGTQYLVLGRTASSVHDFALGGERPLGFELELREMEEVFHPMVIRLEVEGPAGEAELVDLSEGRSAGAAGGELELSFRRFDGGRGVVELEAAASGGRETLRLDLVGGETSRAAVGPHRIVLRAFRRDLKDMRSLVAVLQGGRAVKEGWLSPRTAFGHRGMTFHQVGWGTDKYGFRYIGLQASRDPGAPLFWAGCLVMAVSVTAMMARRLPGKRPPAPSV